MTSLQPDTSGWDTLGSFALTADLPAFDGHFPGLPVMPGAWLLDWVLGLLQADDDAPLRVREARFLQAARPGDRLVALVAPAGPRRRFAVQDLHGKLLCTGTLEQTAMGEAA